MKGTAIALVILATFVAVRLEWPRAYDIAMMVVGFTSASNNREQERLDCEQRAVANAIDDALAMSKLDEDRQFIVWSIADDVIEGAQNVPPDEDAAERAARSTFIEAGRDFVGTVFDDAMKNALNKGLDDAGKLCGTILETRGSIYGRGRSEPSESDPLGILPY